ncbi:MAG: aromatic ring-hydroxylating dioxygenase subunit alpha [Pseudomonadota bacterium]
MDKVADDPGAIQDTKFEQERMLKSPFILNAWYVAAESEEIVVGKPLGRVICGESIVFYRDRSGTCVALENRCRHKSYPLDRSQVEGDDIRCGYHGFLWGPNGRCKQIPGQDMIPPSARIRAYLTEDRHGWVWIWMGDPALADPADICDYHWLADPEWGAKRERLHVKANYRLIASNLLDLTHLAFVHGTTIGNAAVIEHAAVTFERNEYESKVIRWMTDVPPPASYIKAYGFQGNIDRWMIVHFSPPGFCRLYTGGAEAGTGIREGATVPHMGWRNLNAITPETETTSHYFWGQAHNHDPQNATLTDLVFGQVRHAFQEDQVVFEAQQVVMDQNRHLPQRELNTAADAGALHAMRVIDRLLARQHAGQNPVMRHTDLQWGPRF